LKEVLSYFKIIDLMKFQKVSCLR